MSINWNKEVKFKDVQKFFNQEIHIGEIDYHKCLQVSALIVAFGVIPAFTYGFVLNSLEDQRLSLMSEVSRFQAQLINVKQTGQLISDVTISGPQSYEATATSSVTFLTYTTVNATSGTLYYRLLDTDGKVMFLLGTTTFSFPTIKIGGMVFNKSFTMASTSVSILEKSGKNKFAVQVLHIPSGQYKTSSYIEINRYKAPNPVAYAGSDAVIIPSLSNLGESQTGLYKIAYRVTANDNDLYVSKGLSGVTFSRTSKSTITSWEPTPASIRAYPSGIAVQSLGDVYKIPKGQSVLFILTVINNTPKDSGLYGVQINNISLGKEQSSIQKYDTPDLKTQEINLSLGKLDL